MPFCSNVSTTDSSEVSTAWPLTIGWARDARDSALAPTSGQHNDEVLADVCGYDAGHIAALRAAGALGAPEDG